MRMRILTAAFAGMLALASCETTGGGGYGGGGGGGTQLSQCTRNAIVGAVVGGVIGAAQDSRNNRAENAALGAAVGGAATYGVCRWLTAREQQRVENGYYQALNSGSGYNDQWQSDQGAPRQLSVAPPQSSSRGPQCRTVHATVNDPQYGSQQLPPETFCRTPSGQWAPA